METNSQNEQAGQVVRAPVSEQRLREMMKGDKDFRIRVDLDGAVTAHCKSCDCDMTITESSGLVWFLCPACQRASFYPAGNISRDTQIARQDGAPLEYELFYLKDLPPSLRPPV